MNIAGFSGSDSFTVTTDNADWIESTKTVNVTVDSGCDGGDDDFSPDTAPTPDVDEGDTVTLNNFFNSAVWSTGDDGGVVEVRLTWPGDDLTGDMNVTYSDSGVTITGDGEGVTQVWVEATSEYAGNLSVTWNDAYGGDELFVDPIRTQEDGVLTLGDITTTGGLSVEGGVDVTGDLTGAYVIAVSSGNISTTITANTFANVTAPGFTGTITSNGTASLSVGSGDADGTVTAVTGASVSSNRGSVTGDITVTSGSLTVSAYRDITGSLDDTGGGGGTLTATSTYGDILGDLTVSSGSLTANATNGNISSSISGNITGASITCVDFTGSVDTSAAANITITSFDTLDGSITTGGNLNATGNRDITGDLSASGTLTISAGRDMSGSANGGNIGSVIIGRDLETDLESNGNIGNVNVGRTLDGDITATSGSIGNITIGGSAWSDAYTAEGSVSGVTITAGTSVGNVSVKAAIGYNTTMSGTTITASNGSIGNITAVSGIGVTANASLSIGSISTTNGDISGSITAGSGNIGGVTASNGSLSASLHAGGSIGALTIYNNITGTITAVGNIGGVTASNGNITGSITASNGSIGNIAAYGNITSTLAAGSNSSLANCSIGNITVGGSLSGNVTAAGSIGAVTTQGTLSGQLTAINGSIGTVWSFGSITKDIISHNGTLTVFTGGDLTGNLSAPSSITLVAIGSVTGKVTVTSFGQIMAFVGGNIISTADADFSAPGEIYAVAVGNILATLVSAHNQSFMFAGGTISDPHPVEAGWLIDGIEAHQIIAENYDPTFGRFAWLNRSIGTIVSEAQLPQIAPVSPAEILLRPDIVNRQSYALYEIKSMQTGPLRAQADALFYMGILNTYGIPASLGVGIFDLHSTSGTFPMPDGRVLTWMSPWAGVILYQFWPAPVKQPELVPVLLPVKKESPVVSVRPGTVPVPVSAPSFYDTLVTDLKMVPVVVHVVTSYIPSAAKLATALVAYEASSTVTTLKQDADALADDINYILKHIPPPAPLFPIYPSGPVPKVFRR